MQIPLMLSQHKNNSLFDWLSQRKNQLPRDWVDTGIISARTLRWCKRFLLQLFRQNIKVVIFSLSTSEKLRRRPQKRRLMPFSENFDKENPRWRHQYLSNIFQYFHYESVSRTAIWMRIRIHNTDLFCTNFLHFDSTFYKLSRKISILCHIPL